MAALQQHPELRAPVRPPKVQSVQAQAGPEVMQQRATLQAAACQAGWQVLSSAAQAVVEAGRGWEMRRLHRLQTLVCRKISPQ